MCLCVYVFNFLVVLVNNMCKNRNILLTAYGGMRACGHAGMQVLQYFIDFRMFNIF